MWSNGKRKMRKYYTIINFIDPIKSRIGQTWTPGKGFETMF